MRGKIDLIASIEYLIVEKIYSIKHLAMQYINLEFFKM
jgi:hypothetical protein